MQQTANSRGNSPVTIIGAGIAGAWQALLFAQAGHAVTLHERGDARMTESTSHWAGGMLAPRCEAETSEPLIGRLGIRSLKLWRELLPDTEFNGSLVVAHARDRSDFERFARMTTDYRRLDAAGLQAALHRGSMPACAASASPALLAGSAIPSLARPLTMPHTGIIARPDSGPERLARNHG